MENATKLSIQNFDFRDFVTEIFPFKVGHFSKNLKIKKSEKWPTLNRKFSVPKFNKQRSELTVL